MNIRQQLQAILLLPVMVTLVIPATILFFGRSSVSPAFWLQSRRRAPLAAGAMLLVMGLVLVVQTVRLIATRGRGTLAPWDPPQRLVVHGVYRHVRNPMISGVVAILLAEALIFGSLPLLTWAGIFFGINALYIPLSEEPGLERRFGNEYRLYKRHVPRWLPRLRPWFPESGTH
jgi:protein-S-isoprenylcysteine O-methyltransferase Ste14